MNDKTWVKPGECKRMQECIKQHKFYDFLGMYLLSLPNNMEPYEESIELLGDNASEEEKRIIAQKMMIKIINGDKK